MESCQSSEYLFKATHCFVIKTDKGKTNYDINCHYETNNDINCHYETNNDINCHYDSFVVKPMFLFPIYPHIAQTVTTSKSKLTYLY